MPFLEWIIEKSVQFRWMVLLGTLGFIALGLWSFQETRFDAFPDLTNVQVQILTASPGMASEEVELLVTRPIERALSGVPGAAEIRSLSRTGISAITVVFDDETDIWLARQLIKERLDGARDDIPPSAGTPELAPPTTGLGEVYQFTLTSDRHSAQALHRIFERDVAPRLRTIDGVVEVNAWGGGAPQLHVRVDPFKMSALKLSLGDLEDALRGSLGIASGGAIVSGSEQRLVRAVANPSEPQALEALPIKKGPGGELFLRDVARVTEAPALTTGLGSADGHGEAMFVVVQLLAGADALKVVDAVQQRSEEVQASLPDGVKMEVVYDRKKLVGNTLQTVAKSLLEGGLLVVFVLLLFLGDLRAGLLVASVIPLSMLGAFIGLNALGFSGNLMSLGAIDFGIIVDPTIVVIESIVALTLGRELWGKAIVKKTQRVARPVFFATGILLLVYLPVLLMVGTEGKLFRPMAVTVLLALATALVLSFTYIPAIASLIIKPKGDHQPWFARGLRKVYAPILSVFLRRPSLAVLLMLLFLGASVWTGSTLGVEFVPRLEEGDMVIQTERLPSLSPELALSEATRIEKIVMSFPEVERIASRTGAPGLATDPMGLEEADILVLLAPRSGWTTADSTEGLVEAISSRIEAEAPGAALTFTQPIEMRFNELLEGITSDVGVTLYGPDLDTLMRLAQEVAAELEKIEGAADVAPPIMDGIPSYDVKIDAERLAKYPISAQEVLAMVSTIQRGREVGSVIRGAFRDPVLLKVDWPDDMPLQDMPLTLPNGHTIPLSEVASVEEVQRATTIEREAGSRRVIIEANVRGRDIGSFVQEAQERLKKIDLPDGYWMDWSGKYEQLKEAATRMSIMIPIIIFLILGALHLALQNIRLALLISLNVPIAASGGILALWWMRLPLSMSAIVGFIALFGIAVMNGIVMISRAQELRPLHGTAAAAKLSALERLRPVMMTASTDAIGFLPMALATGVGAEVQRPLATVVIGGLITSTLLTLFVLPSLYGRFFHGESDLADVS